MGRRSSYSNERLQEIVPRCISYAQVIKELGLKAGGGTQALLKVRLKEAGIDTSHFLGQGHLRSGHHGWARKAPIGLLLVKNGPRNGRNTLKRRLLEDGLLRNECYLCGLLPRWKDKPLVLVLDHINGIRNDNRLENLRLLCPNCNSQTDTFAARNKGRKKAGVTE